MTDEAVLRARPATPRLLRYSDVPRWLWGDPTSRHVTDWLYMTSDKIHFIMLSLRPGACWRHSETFKPVYGADEGYYVLQGSLTLHNPKTGEVHIVNEGEALHFREGTWHYGYNFTTGETLVLEAFAPVPTDVSPDALSRRAPPLEVVQGGRYELMDNWPWNAAAARETETIRPLRADDWLHLIQGEQTPVLVSLFLATDKLTMGRMTLLPGVESEPETHPGDEVVVVTEGRLNIRLSDTQEWYELHPRDGFFLPEGTRHQYFNMSDRPTTVVFGVAPHYR